MLCPPITESSWEPMTVEEDQEQEETKEEEEYDKMKALSCMDRVRGLNCLSLFIFICSYSTEEHIYGKLLQVDLTNMLCAFTCRPWILMRFNDVNVQTVR